MLLAMSSITGLTVEAEDGKIGTVSDFLFDDRTWKLRWMVIDTSGWLTGRKVLVHPSSIGPVDYPGGRLAVHLSKHQVKDSPGISSDAPVSRQMQDGLYGYYGWDPLWGGGSYFGGYYPYAMGMPPATRGHHYDEGELLAADRIDQHRDDADPHLRSVAAVSGYHIQATDGSIGHIQNFMLETDNWGIRYLVVDTKNWWPGKHVLLSPYAVTNISWGDREVTVDLSRERVKASPPWDRQPASTGPMRSSCTAITAGPATVGRMSPAAARTCP